MSDKQSVNLQWPPGASVSLPRLLAELLRATEGRQFEVEARVALEKVGWCEPSERGTFKKCVLTPVGQELADVLLDFGRRAMNQ